MIVLTRLRLPEACAVHQQAADAAAALAEQPGCLSARLSRCLDEPELWALVTTWQGVGAYRRALSSTEVKLRAVPVLYQAIDEPSAYEDARTWTPEQGWHEHPSDLAGGTRGQ